MLEKELYIPVGDSQMQISATLTYENSLETLVIIIPGTGKVDRDGNVKEMRANLYKELSDKLSLNGFATLRYDKLGVGKSTGDYYSVGLWDLLESIKSIITYFRCSKDYKFKRIVLLGHSEGTILATLLVGKIHVDGLILIAGAGSSLKSVMLAQSNLLSEEVNNKKGIAGALLRSMISKDKIYKKQMQLFDKVSQSNEDFIRVSGQKIQAKWLREHLSIDDAFVNQQLMSINHPFLVINGDKDLQIDNSSLSKLETLNNPNKSIVTIAGMNHMLKYQIEACSILKLKQIYMKMVKLPISDELLIEITKWLNNMENNGGKN